MVLRIVALCLAVSSGMYALDVLNLLDRAELWTVDGRFQVRGARPQHGDVMVVGIDQASLGRYGKWPWRLSVHAGLVRALTDAGARLIVFDVFFSEAERQRVDEESQLAREMKRSGRVLLAVQYSPPLKTQDATLAGSAPEAVAMPLFVDPSRLDSYDLLTSRSPKAPKELPHWLLPRRKQFFWSVPGAELTRAAIGFGTVDMDPDPDGIFRRVQPIQAVENGRFYLHLGVAAAAAALGVPPEEITLDRTGNLRLGDQRTLPVDADGRIWIDFAGGAARRTGEGLRELRPSAFPYASYAAVREGREPASRFRDKVVFVGAVAKGLGDVRANPFDAAGSGVDISAHLTDAILARRLPRSPGPAVLPLMMLLLALLLCLTLSARTPAAATAATAVVLLPFLAASYALFSEGKLFLPLATPMLTVAACYTGAMTLRFATEQREQRRVRRFFERYVTREIAARVLEDPEAAQMGGRRREVTMLFSDIRGFTSMSEKLAAEVVIDLLNEYFGVMVPIIERRGGTINNFIGDAIFAFWGAPLAQADQAERAVLSGLEMLEAMPALQARWREQGLPSFEIGIGIHLGTAVVGNIGTEQRSHYTTIGDDVNTASRLESLNSREGTKYLISEAVYERVAHRVEARRMPPLSVKNKAEPLSVYEVLGRKETEAVAEGNGPPLLTERRPTEAGQVTSQE